MKKFIYAFLGVIIGVCLTFIIVQFATGGINENAHLHFDVFVATASNTFNEFMDDGMGATSILQVDNPLEFIWVAIKSIIALFRVVVVLFQTPVIY